MPTASQSYSQFRQDLSFSSSMESVADKIYHEVLGATTIHRLRTDGLGAHILDKEFGIDCKLELSDGQHITMQEKFRKFRAQQYSDITWEHHNARGTRFEAPGEWFHIQAQLYFYGWASFSEKPAFERWIIFQVMEAKVLIEELGGLYKCGERRQNNKHGSSDFYCINPRILKPAILAAFNLFENGLVKYRQFPLQPINGGN